MLKVGYFYRTEILIALFGLILAPGLWAQTRPIARVGGTLIDGTEAAAVAESVVVIRDGKFQEVGERGKVSIPQGAEVIEAKGKSILPGLIDGHCHYRDWMGEVYLATDITAGRKAALKLLPMRFTSDIARLKRFQQEAMQSLGSIIQIFLRFTRSARTIQFIT